MSLVASYPRRAGQPYVPDRPFQEAVRLRAVSKIYETESGETVHALSNINLDVRSGEFLSVIGASGCGKTTLLRIIAGLEGGYDGELSLRGDSASQVRRNVGIVFQDSNLLPWRNILQNVLLPAQVLRLDRRASIERAHELIELVGLKGFEHKYPYELSGGMRQRISIARALVHDPAVLLMDEPFGALDALTREVMNVEVLKIWEATNKTVFMITHSISEAVFMGDRVVVMSPRPGRVVAEVDIALPRPRNIETLSGEAFAAYTGQLRRLLDIGSSRKEGA
ncbi:ABC transporter ATP-binding protein [Bradyrhizobium sp. BRP22]|uniref:ABC transporter ATP-binding protein n=1 Tax=Bradyrhizobium sp. BRP22 TaxID=2793821 RepID=UPI001CD7874E|nr:ABC transporter ATP-binding protein [Bradyrhizobium sp. BRP22]MCA1452987.1 ABC transporter ATP-binding protein [Bradyrhizobium sp. BRP22]